MAIIVDVCRRCGETTELYSSTKWCRPCQAAYYRERRKLHPEEAKARDAKDRAKRGDYFRAKAKEQYSRITDAQRAEKREYQRKWYQRNRAREYAKNQTWRLAHPWLFRFYQRKHYALKFDVVHIPFSAEQLDQKFSLWGYACWLCRRPATQVDHVKPLAKGGPHILANLRPICGPCNSKKKDRWPFKAA